MHNEDIHVRQAIFSKSYHFFIIPFFAVVFDQLNVLNNPERSPLINIQKRGFYHYISYFFRHLYLFELITFLILAILIKLYSRYFKLTTIKTSLKSLLIYELKWFPLFVTSIFIFGPVTNFFRYIFLFYPGHHWSLYFPEFFMSFSMYFNYLIPILIWGYLIVNTNLLFSYFNRNEKNKSFEPEDIQVGTALQTITYIKIIEGGHAKGLTMLTIGEVLWFEVLNKAYYAHLADEVYSVRKTIAELDNELDPEMFFRINRSQIINLHYVQSYSYWEFEKYIVRLAGVEQKDFIITRKRFKELKEKIEMIKSA